MCFLRTINSQFHVDASGTELSEKPDYKEYGQNHVRDIFPQLIYWSNLNNVGNRSHNQNDNKGSY
jgi:hypothetical protein